MNVSFTIAFIVHTGHEIMSLTIPQNIEALCGYTCERFDLILIADGVTNHADRCKLLRAADSWGIDEVRFRSRRHNCAGGDPSNNGHFHTLSLKTPYLMTLEEDVVIFLQDRTFDVLAEFRALFDRHPRLALATRMDDSDCWVWKLEQSGPDIEPGVKSVNRVASHFLTYATGRMAGFLRSASYCPEVFYDQSKNWFNYEDLISATFAEPAGPGIAFVQKFPIRVFHCDLKVAEGSPYYTKELTAKVGSFHARKREAGNGCR
jgi:hypothetical protein